jgi:hypothetical protein
MSFPRKVLTKIVENVPNLSQLTWLSKQFQQVTDIENAVRMSQFYTDILTVDPIELVERYSAFHPVLPYMYLLYPEEFGKYAIKRDRKLFHRLFQTIIKIGLIEFIKMIGTDTRHSPNDLFNLALMILLNDNDPIPSKLLAEVPKSLTKSTDRERNIFHNFNTKIKNGITYSKFLKFDERKMFSGNDINRAAIEDMFIITRSTDEYIDMFTHGSIKSFSKRGTYQLLEFYNNYRMGTSGVFETGIKIHLFNHLFDYNFTYINFKFKEQTCRLIMEILQLHINKGTFNMGMPCSIIEFSALLINMLNSSLDASIELFKDVSQLIQMFKSLIGDEIVTNIHLPKMIRKSITPELIKLIKECGYFNESSIIGEVLLLCLPEEIPEGYSFDELTDREWDYLLTLTEDPCFLEWETTPTSDQLISCFELTRGIIDRDVKNKCISYFKTVMWKFRIIEVISYLHSNIDVLSYDEEEHHYNNYSPEFIADLDVYNKFYTAYLKTGMFQSYHHTVYDVMITPDLTNHHLHSINLAIQYAISKVIKQRDYKFTSYTSYRPTALFKYVTTTIQNSCEV